MVELVNQRKKQARKGLHSEKTDEDESEASKDADPISGTNIPVIQSSRGYKTTMYRYLLRSSSKERKESLLNLDVIQNIYMLTERKYPLTAEKKKKQAGNRKVDNGSSIHHGISLSRLPKDDLPEQNGYRDVNTPGSSLLAFRCVLLIWKEMRNSLNYYVLIADMMIGLLNVFRRVELKNNLKIRVLFTNILRKLNGKTIEELEVQHVKIKLGEIVGK
ncbi:hypothetical protein Tco_0088995 [Tanacetum coccineum]